MCVLWSSTSTHGDLDGAHPYGARAFLAYLLDEKDLAIKSCKNIINASFRACYRDARKFDRLPDAAANPFADLSWPRMKSGRPDPFGEAERDKILDYFKRRIPHYYPLPFASS